MGIKLTKVCLFVLFLGIQMVIYVAFVIESTTALGGIFGLKALTGNTPYTGLGNPWITYPRIANGGGIGRIFFPLIPPSLSFLLNFTNFSFFLN